MNEPMKRIYFIFSAAVAAFSLALVSCESAPKGDKAEVGEAQEVVADTGRAMVVDITSSTVGFTGNGVGKNHPGAFSLKSGSLAVKGAEITGGSFVIDIASMTLSQPESYINEKLRPHLLSPDFFDVEKYPEATFELTGISAYTPADGESAIAGANYKVSGNLKLRDQVKNVTFPAHITFADGTVKAEASFDIDRTQWGMSYGNDKSLKDKFISPTVNIALSLTAKG